MKLLILLLSLLMMCSVFAEDVYHIRHLSERELGQTYATLLLDTCHHDDPFDMAQRTVFRHGKRVAP